ncbi:MAG: hypothetical protein ACD_22C00236G0002 [uncultured bacterium]|nr:MAG: hypothetical protein ACD_22C00236G0002 [uncultured bacterium]
MLKNKITVKTLFTGMCLMFVLLFAPEVSAGNIVTIQSLPSYINTDTFKLSCTSNAPSVSFSVSKHGGAFVTFATVNLTANPCQVQVTSSQINEQTDYVFMVSDGVTSSSTSTIFDTNGPAAVSDYYKDGLSDGYRLHWRNSSSADFDKVIIYRGDTPDFSADSSHEIATVMGSPDSLMTYEDHSGPNKYYDIRALDHAGNSSGLVGDGGGTTTIVTTPSPVAAGGSQVIIVPETGGGSILGVEASPSPEPTATPKANIVEQVNEFAAGTSEPFKWVLTHKKISLGILLTLAAATYIVLGIIKKKK